MLTLRYFKKLVTVTIGTHTIKAEAKKIISRTLAVGNRDKNFFSLKAQFSLVKLLT